MAKGWTYGLTGSVSWFDSQGGFHLDGWPECLTDQTKSARFEAASQAVNLIGKPVLAVDCQYRRDPGEKPWPASGLISGCAAVTPTPRVQHELIAPR